MSGSGVTPHRAVHSFTAGAPSTVAPCTCSRPVPPASYLLILLAASFSAACCRAARNDMTAGWWVGRVRLRLKKKENSSTERACMAEDKNNSIAYIQHV